MINTWPVVAAHSDATCFNCQQATVKPQASGNAPRHGAYMQWCDTCKMWTFYDLAAAVKPTNGS